MDLRIWVFLAIVFSLIIEPVQVDASLFIIVALMIQMTLSIDGMSISKNDFNDNKKYALISIILCYLINTGITLLIGLPFIESHPNIWHGWIMMASMPCAIAVVTAATLKNSNLSVMVMAVSGTYVAGLLLAPLISFSLMGNAVNPLEILKYIILFIIIPLLISIPMKKLKLKRTTKVPIINMMMALMLFFSVNANKSLITSDPGFILLIIGFVLLRFGLLNVIAYFITKKSFIPDDSRIPFLILTVWKNTGLAISMSMVLLVPEAVLPCVISMIIETPWFSMVTRNKNPKKENNAIINS